MAANVTPIPEGYHTITPGLILDDADRAIAFYKEAFGAEELGTMRCPEGKVMHSALKVGDSILFLSDEFPQCQSRSPRTLGHTSVSLYLYVEDADAAFDRAVAAGAEVTCPVTDVFWGDRFGAVRDPFGHMWSLASRKEILSREETARRAEAFFAAPAGAN
jgi:uncharacterized glyoxalase superfamily protein PhnB